MLGIRIRRLLTGLVAIGFVTAVVSLTLVYFFPAPPSTVTLATAFKGASFDYYGRRYKERLARDHVNLELRETVGAVENLKLLQDPQSGVDAAFVAGGISNGKQAPGLLSLGITYNNAFWVFYSSSQSIEHLPQLKRANALPSDRLEAPPDKRLKEFWAWPAFQKQRQRSCLSQAPPQLKH